MIDPITKDKSKIYKSIELILIQGESRVKVTYDNSAMLISGNHLILMNLEGGHQKGDIYNLDKVQSYRTNLEKPE
jgi:hypothetical protein|tara:strand:+ start:141 stop:365 length:225 start_codon:yes stop_codon:yes gene_type:complete